MALRLLSAKQYFLLLSQLNIAFCIWVVEKEYLSNNCTGNLENLVAWRADVCFPGSFEGLPGVNSYRFTCGSPGTRPDVLTCTGGDCSDCSTATDLGSCVVDGQLSGSFFCQAASPVAEIPAGWLYDQIWLDHKYCHGIPDKIIAEPMETCYPAPSGFGIIRYDNFTGLITEKTCRDSQCADCTTTEILPGGGCVLEQTVTGIINGLPTNQTYYAIASVAAAETWVVFSETEGFDCAQSEQAHPNHGFPTGFVGWQIGVCFPEAYNGVAGTNSFYWSCSGNLPVAYGCADGSCSTNCSAVGVYNGSSCVETGLVSGTYFCSQSSPASYVPTGWVYEQIWVNHSDCSGAPHKIEAEPADQCFPAPVGYELIRYNNRTGWINETSCIDPQCTQCTLDLYVPAGTCVVDAVSSVPIAGRSVNVTSYVIAAVAGRENWVVYSETTGSKCSGTPTGLVGWAAGMCFPGAYDGINGTNSYYWSCANNIPTAFACSDGACSANCSAPAAYQQNICVPRGPVSSWTFCGQAAPSTYVPSGWLYQQIWVNRSSCSGTPHKIEAEPSNQCFPADWTNGYELITYNASTGLVDEAVCSDQQCTNCNKTGTLWTGSCMDKQMDTVPIAGQPTNITSYFIAGIADADTWVVQSRTSGPSCNGEPLGLTGFMTGQCFPGAMGFGNTSRFNSYYWSCSSNSPVIYSCTDGACSVGCQPATTLSVNSCTGQLNGFSSVSFSCTAESPASYVPKGWLYKEFWLNKQYCSGSAMMVTAVPLDRCSRAQGTGFGFFSYDNVTNTVTQYSQCANFQCQPATCTESVRYSSSCVLDQSVTVPINGQPATQSFYAISSVAGKETWVIQSQTAGTNCSGGAVAVQGWPVGSQCFPGPFPSALDALGSPANSLSFKWNCDENFPTIVRCSDPFCMNCTLPVIDVLSECVADGQVSSSYSCANVPPNSLIPRGWLYERYWVDRSACTGAPHMMKAVPTDQCFAKSTSFETITYDRYSGAVNEYTCSDNRCQSGCRRTAPIPYATCTLDQAFSYPGFASRSYYESLTVTGWGGPYSVPSATVDEPKGLSGGAIAGITIAVILVVVLVVAFIVYQVRSRRTQGRSYFPSSTNDDVVL